VFSLKYKNAVVFFAPGGARLKTNGFSNMEIYFLMAHRRELTPAGEKIFY
jgi:hypothetical protein